MLVSLILIGTGPQTERIGDRLQVALPLVALGCAIADGRGVQFLGRYVLLEAGIKGPKFLLGDLPINQRPNGGGQGFPSGHTAAATFGATSLAATCMSNSKLAQGVVLISAAFVGGSRVEASKHSIWQALAGCIWGWFAQAAGLQVFDRWFRRIWRKSGAGVWRSLMFVRHAGLRKTSASR
ncbi:MAG: phosphatase PAP2 family protein [Octadecabacter sp.]